MANTPVLNEREVLQLLRAQGFRTEPTTNGYKVFAPDGKGTGGFHSSTFTADANHGYLNMMAQLRRIGLDLAQHVPEHLEDPDWKRERAAIDQLIADQDSAAAAKRTEEADMATKEAKKASAIAELTPARREVYDAIIADPGLHPWQYADKLHLSQTVCSNRASYLFADGLIEGTGSRITRRYYPAGEVPEGPAPAPDLPPSRQRSAKATSNGNGRPSAGPVRVSQMEAGDATVRFKRMGQKAMRLKDELESILVTMVDQYEAQEAELTRLKQKNSKMTEVLGRAVDVL